MNLLFPFSSFYIYECVWYDISLDIACMVCQSIVITVCVFSFTVVLL